MTQRDDNNSCNCNSENPELHKGLGKFGRCRACIMFSLAFFLYFLLALFVFKKYFDLPSINIFLIYMCGGFGVLFLIHVTMFFVHKNSRT
jgi:hypothetical protein